MKQVKESIIDSEDKRLIPYNLEYTNKKTGEKVIENFKTVGYGRRIYGKAKDIYTQEEIDKFLEEDLAKAAEDAADLLDLSKVHPQAHGIVTQMVYQMGKKGVGDSKKGFVKTLKYINKGQYKEASKEMLHSNWANQTPRPAIKLSKLMRQIGED